jgi:sRNA-binding protein
MHVSEDGSVVGSVDRSRLEEIEATSDEAKAELERLQTEAAAAEEEAAKLLESRTPEAEVPEPEPAEPESQPRASMAQSKDELIDQAEAAGLDTEGKTKQELVDELNAGTEG